MKYSDINKMFTTEVNKYLAQGYRFNTASMNGSQGELAKVDLTNGTEIIRIVARTFSKEWDKQGRERGHSAGCGLLRQHNLERTLGTSQQPAVLRGERLRRSRQVLWDGSGRRSGQQSPYEPLCAEAESQG